MTLESSPWRENEETPPFKFLLCHWKEKVVQRRWEVFVFFSVGRFPVKEKPRLRRARKCEEQHELMWKVWLEFAPLTGATLPRAPACPPYTATCSTQSSPLGNLKPFSSLYGAAVTLPSIPAISTLRATQPGRDLWEFSSRLFLHNALFRLFEHIRILIEPIMTSEQTVQRTIRWWKCLDSTLDNEWVSEWANEIITFQPLDNIMAI